MAGSIHGGRFWSIVQNDLDRLDSVVRADVLDAWFPPPPEVLAALRHYDVELCRTSPEAEALPLRAAIGEARGIPPESIVTGAGSSALIYLALPFFGAKAQSALILDPMYGEYRHVLENLCQLPVHTLDLDPRDGYRLQPERFLEAPGDCIALVNPNSPTGSHVPRLSLEPIVRELAKTRVVWIDETYIDYAGTGESLESMASENPNVIVCKSMSKVYALSGLRCAYLVSHPDRTAQIVRYRPPWAVSLPAQVCGSLALRAGNYYESRYEETARLRQNLRLRLEEIGLEVTEGVINALLVHLPPDGPSASGLAGLAEGHGIYLRDAASMGASMGTHTLRVSVRGEQENVRIADTIRMCTEATSASLPKPLEPPIGCRSSTR
ncbi:MAG TPA: histidinol-phosphate transaminase [Fimbriimonadaceae bacterium]|nr:histidinol-phosphate transaminase [Fimbriimonadaceae bacterium]